MNRKDLLKKTLLYTQKDLKRLLGLDLVSVVLNNPYFLSDREGITEAEITAVTNKHYLYNDEGESELDDELREIERRAEEYFLYEVIVSISLMHTSEYAKIYGDSKKNKEGVIVFGDNV